MSIQNAPTTFLSPFEGQQYIALTTFRRNGEPVTTPVWFSVDGDHLVIKTGTETGKAKRMRRTARVLVAPSTARGQAKSEPVEAAARFLPPEEFHRIERLMARKYGLVWPIYYTVFPWVQRLRGKHFQATYLTISPA